MWGSARAAQPVAKLAAGAPEPSLDGADGPVELGRGLLVGLALEIAEDERQAVTVRQAVQLLVDDRAGDDLGKVVVWLRLGS